MATLGSTLEAPDCIEVCKVAQSDAVGDRVLQLAHVARPGVALQRLEQLSGGPFGAATVRFPEMLREHRNVTRALPQRGDRHARHSESKVEIVPEAALVDLALQIATRGAKDPHVHARPPGATDALHLCALDRAQQFGLQRYVEVANLVEEQRPAVCLLKHTDSRPHRAGECSLLVPKERRLD